MAVNVYGTAAHLRMRRSLFNRNFSHKTSEKFGKLQPIGGPQEVLPGDLWSLKLSSVKRMLTPKAPIMDDISGDIYGFFVPNRIIWSKAKNFFGENDQVAWTLPENISIPRIILGMDSLDAVSCLDSDQDFDSGYYLYEVNAGSGIVQRSIFSGTIFEYFGLPFVWPNADLLSQIEGAFNSENFDLIKLNALPFRAYQMIYNEFFRNENVSDPILDLNYDGNDFTLDLMDFIDAIRGNGDNIFDLRLWKMAGLARWKDLFTSCLPAPQRGPAVGLPLVGNAPIISDTSLHSTGNDILFGNGVAAVDSGVLGIGANNKFTVEDASGITVSNPRIINQTSLLADMSAVASATVNQIRLAFATQRYYEKLARGGARYKEYLNVMFGVSPSNAVLDRPQFLGGHHYHINVSQVIATANSTDVDGDVQSLGQTGAVSVTGFRSHIFSNSFTEHGVLLCFDAIRKEHTYAQGLDKYWTKTDVFDIYNPTFAHIGEVPVMKNEVYWQPGNSDVLGYNEAWYEYRSQRSMVSGLLNPLHPEALGYYVLTDIFNSAPSLTDGFILEDPNGLDRALVASADVTDQFITDFYFEYKLARVMPTRSIPGLIDHY